jgi:predicted Holliday junction resolvase-like endonuclease
MRIPEIRAELRALAYDLRCQRLFELADELERRSPKERTRAKSVPMTEELRKQIRTFKKQNPGASQVEIAKFFNVNPGRVSETLAGFRP